jgi:hypothetical protein
LVVTHAPDQPFVNEPPPGLIVPAPLEVSIATSAGTPPFADARSKP